MKSYLLRVTCEIVSTEGDMWNRIFKCHSRGTLRERSRRVPC